MAYLRTLLVLWTLILAVQARRLIGHKHEAFDIKKIRQAEPVSALATASNTGILTLLTPSPGASPVEVTKQSQIVTSYIPEYTLCELPPIGFMHVSRPSDIASTAPYRNYSISIPSVNGTCTTYYKTTATMVCATTLTDLTTTYPVTKCPQDITFSTRYGYVLATPTATANFTGNWTTGYHNSSASYTSVPMIRTLTSFFLAPWQQLTTAGPPTDVDIKVCVTFENGTENCVREYQVWTTRLETITATSTTAINFTTTIPGPSQLIVETFSANLTAVMTTFTMSEMMRLSYIKEARITDTFSVSGSTGPTVTQTQTVELAT